VSTKSGNFVVFFVENRSSMSRAGYKLSVTANLLLLGFEVV
jgi:hypothetical protein